MVRRALRREVERLETEIEQRLSKQQSKSLPGESDFGQTCVLPYTVEKVRVATFRRARLWLRRSGSMRLEFHGSEQKTR